MSGGMNRDSVTTDPASHAGDGIGPIRPASSDSSSIRQLGAVETAVFRFILLQGRQGEHE
jgi:hypothetical protein